MEVVVAALELFFSSKSRTLSGSETPSPQSPVVSTGRWRQVSAAVAAADLSALAAKLT